jgi:glycosyltransferase involved in cell wall biosynthesis
VSFSSRINGLRATFITSTPMNVKRGSGTFVGIDALARSLRGLDWSIDLVTPRLHLPNYTAERICFNETLRFRRDFEAADLTVGFDLDGYTLPATLRRKPHIASIKGVIADEMRYEKGLTRATMAVQAYFEARHVRKAQFVITTSEYAASRLKDLYGIPRVHAIIPELIDLTEWQGAVSRCNVKRDAEKFIVLCVARFYPRKRMELLLYAADVLRSRIPDLEIRIVGGGAESLRLRTLRERLRVSNVVIRENISPAE